MATAVEVPFINHKPVDGKNIVRGYLMPEDYTEDQIKAIRNEYAKGATDDQFHNFLRECAARQLLPGKHVYFQLRTVSEWDADTRSKIKVKRAAHQTSIDAFRLIANRTKQYEGQEPFVYIYLDDENKPNVRSTVPLPDGDSTEDAKQPWAVEAAVYRAGFRKALTAVARFEAYAVTYFKDNKTKLSDMWKRRGPEQLAKCAEALALRQAFPEELGGLYISEELRDEAEPEAQQADAKPATEAPTAVTAPAVDHKPAEGKEDVARPGEKKGRKKAEKKVDKEAEPAQQDAPPATETPAAKVDSPAAKVDKGHPETGYVATDEDLPVNLQPKHEEKPKEEKPKEEKKETAKAEPDRLPTAEEKQQIGTKLRTYKQDNAMMRAFCLRQANADDTRKVTLAQWNEILGMLDSAEKNNTLDKVVGGK